MLQVTTVKPPLNCTAVENIPWVQLLMDVLIPQNINKSFDEIMLSNFNTTMDEECLLAALSSSPSPYSSSVHVKLPLVKKLALGCSSFAILANICSLLAICNIKKKLNANLRLIVSLCLSDTLVAVSVLILSSNNHLVPFVEENSTSPGDLTCVTIVLRSIRMAAHIATLFNLLGLALDHYYAIVKTLYYRIIMDKTKVTRTIIISWTVSFILGFSDFYMPSYMFDHCRGVHHDACSRAACTVYDSEYLVFTMTTISLLIMLFFYLCIFAKLRKKSSALNRHKSVIQKKKRGIITTLFILGTFVIFWLPYCLFESFITMRLAMEDKPTRFSMTILLIYAPGSFYLYCVLLLNSVCDPVIYAWRMREVQRGYKKLFARITCLRYNPIKPTRNTVFRYHSLDSLIQLRLQNKDFRMFSYRYNSQNTSSNTIPTNTSSSFMSNNKPAPHSCSKQLPVNGYVHRDSIKHVKVPITTKPINRTDINEKLRDNNSSIISENCILDNTIEPRSRHINIQHPFEKYILSYDQSNNCNHHLLKNTKPYDIRVKHREYQKRCLNGKRNKQSEDNVSLNLHNNYNSLFDSTVKDQINTFLEKGSGISKTKHAESFISHFSNHHARNMYHNRLLKFRSKSENNIIFLLNNDNATVS